MFDVPGDSGDIVGIEQSKCCMPTFVPVFHFNSAVGSFLRHIADLRVKQTIFHRRIILAEPCGTISQS